jgi:glycosyltransferase involved in cell wall biosynthesis
MRRLFILIPSLAPTGPIKGALAICNSLVEDFNVSLFTLKPSPPFSAYLNPRITLVDLSSAGGFLAKVAKYKSIVKQAGEGSSVISLSLCFSADIVNFLVRRHVITASSIRGHLPRTYRIDYGLFGIFLGFMHYFLVSQLEHAVVMTDGMANQFARFTGKRSVVIGNFIDEKELEPHRNSCSLDDAKLRFVFVGRLEMLKRPELVVEMICQLVEKNIPCVLDIFGDGPLMPRLKRIVSNRGIQEVVHFHGQVNNPWSVAAQADCLVLPSLTEGVSRAALEALYLGVPCVMRDVDSNADLIRPNENGNLFQDDAALLMAMQNTARLGRNLASIRPVLLDGTFRQEECVIKYRNLFLSIL